MSESAPLAAHFREHFEHREHLYGVLLAEMADDIDAGGPTADICVDRLDAPRTDAVPLRLLAGLFRIVLRGDAPELARFYPVLGGHDDPEGAWAPVRAVLASNTIELRGALDLAPQTNEVGRSACLLVGLFEAVRRTGLHRVRLLEPGGSAGLNLNVDRYRFSGPGWVWGPESSALRIDTAAPGVVPADFTVVERRACDVSPVDASSPSGAAYLTSFVWPFHLERHARLAAALDVVRRHPVEVDRAGAAEWVAARLAEPVGEDVLTVVWQSITQQYWPASASAGVAAAIADARSRLPVAHVAMEGMPPAGNSDGYSVGEHGPEVTVDGHLIARAHHHGPPILLSSG